MSSLPVPDSPVTSTVARLGATCATDLKTALDLGGRADDVVKAVALVKALSKLVGLASQRRAFERALEHHQQLVGIERLDEVVRRASRMADTAVSTAPNAVISTTGSSESCSFTFRSSSTPSMPGIFRSVRTICGSNSSSFDVALKPSPAVSTA